MYINRFKILLPLFFLAMLFGADWSVMAQVRESKTETRGQTIRREKDIPIRKGPRVVGNGLPTKLYVIQLARFENLDRFPAEFPKGTFLYSSPDHTDEKILFAGYYGSFEEAKKALATWRKDPMFKGAFARPTPFLVRYD